VFRGLLASKGTRPLRVIGALILLFSQASVEPASTAFALSTDAECPDSNFAVLVSSVGANNVGACIGSEYRNSSDGSVVQSTTGGLLATNTHGDWVSFTDGTSTWVQVAGGPVAKLTGGSSSRQPSAFRAVQAQSTPTLPTGAPFGTDQNHPGKFVFVHRHNALNETSRSSDQSPAPVQANLGSGPLLYHGGPVERTNAVNFAIYWQPAGTQMTAEYQPLLNQFFGDINGSNLYGVLTQYSDGGGQILNNSQFGGVWIDTSLFPESPLQDLDIQNEVLRAINTNNWDPAGRNANYFVFTPSGVVSCANGLCSNTNFCSYHSGFIASNNVNTVSVRYADMPFANPSGCGHTNTPNGDAFADTEIDDASHELFEMASDPDGSAWFDSTHAEMADKCQTSYGAALNSSGADVVLNGHSYLVQEEWSNAANGCVLSSNPSPPVAVCTPRPAVSVNAGPGIGGQLLVTVTTQGTGVTLQSLQFAASSNGLIDVLGTLGSPGPLNLPLNPGTTAITFVVHRATAGISTTVPFTVIDSCGAWPTFVGGGAGAF
jgi:hypothetical protein